MDNTQEEEKNYKVTVYFMPQKFPERGTRDEVTDKVLAQVKAAQQAPPIQRIVIEDEPKHIDDV